MRSILHVDMDAFYASIEQLDHPEYKGKPVIVGAHPTGGTGRGVVAACSYEARKSGGLTASIGLASNKFVAKVASDLRKPNGFVIVGEREVEEFLRELPISRLWGVGPKTEVRLHEMGFRTIGQLASASRESLVQSLGS